MTIVLASTSKIRTSILGNAGIQHRTVKPTADEERLKAKVTSKIPAELALYLATEKALSLPAAEQANLIIGADQLLLFEGNVFSKPRDTSDARQQLRQLRGKTHQLIAALACCRNGQVLWTHTATATLHMRHFTDAFLETYLTSAGDDVSTSVGAYKLESTGIQLFERVEGDHFTILGLPLLPLLDFLRRQNEIPS